MAVRLSVVMVHTPPAAANASQLAEAIVGELIGMPEIDLTLVGNLASISSESTDLLSLETIAGDVAALDWQPPAGIVSALGELGCEGSRTPHSHDPDAPSAEPTRRIYAFDLNRFPDARSVCDAVAKLKSQRQVRTFTLSAGAGSNVATNTSSATKVSTAEMPKNAPKPDFDVSAVEPPSLGTGGGSNDPLPAARPHASRDLDELLDRLDELDP
jgi:hypothetical protein